MKFLSFNMFKRRTKMRKGFTLMELIIVIIIVGILATVGFGQYQRIIERGRTAEAKTMLGQIRTAQEAYKTEFGTYAMDIIGAPANIRSILVDTTVPTACQLSHYFMYTILSADETTFSAQADRCTAAGKEPNIPAGSVYLITIDQDGTLGGDAAYL
jgi:prepilin-type N-terminal cleavage/methylation domain-containing protein